jgi:hypothetical protein
MQAFRLLDAELVRGALMRTGMWRMEDFEFGNSQCWAFPSLEATLPELHEDAWRAMMEGSLLVEAIEGLRGGRHRAVSPVKLVRLRPDWAVSRLCRGEQDAFIDVRVRRMPADEPAEARGHKKPSQAQLRDVMHEILKGFAADAHPGEAAILRALRDRFPGTTRQQA